MDLLIAILMYLGVYATPEDLQNKDFLERNAGQINKAEQMMKDKSSDLDGIVISGGGNL
jgi:hypothetical protein